MINTFHITLLKLKQKIHQQPQSVTYQVYARETKDSLHFLLLIVVVFVLHIFLCFEGHKKKKKL